MPLIACSYSSDDGKPGIAGTGSGGARSYPVADFTKVDLRGADDIDIRVGGAFSVRAEGDPDVLDYLKIERDGDTLKVGRRNRAGFNWGDRGAKVFVTMPRIGAGAIAGSGDLTIDRAEGARFDGDTAGSGTISIAALAVDAAQFDIAGSGSVDAKGLKANGADVSIAGSGSATLDVTGNAKVSIMGSGDVDLGANARCNVSKMGSGNVRCGG